MSKDVNQQQELSAEQIAELKKRSIDFYKERIEFLNYQHQYEKLIADIEDCKLRGLIATLKVAQITAPPQEEEIDDNPEKTK
jgi:hypothetical protein